MPGTWASGWVVGDVVTAAEFKKGAGCFFDTTLGVASGTVTITCPSVAYASLLIEVYARSSIVNVVDDLYVRANADAGANYNVEVFDISGTTSAASESIGTANGLLVGRCSGDSAPANSFGHAWFQIPHYAGTANHKTVTAQAGHSTADATGGQRMAITSGRWKSTAAITSLVLRANGGNLMIGTRVTGYVLGA